MLLIFFSTCTKLKKQWLKFFKTPVFVTLFYSLTSVFIIVSMDGSFTSKKNPEQDTEKKPF